MQLHHPEQAKAGQRGDRGQCCTLCLVLHFIALLPFVWGGMASIPGTAEFTICKFRLKRTTLAHFFAQSSFNRSLIPFLPVSGAVKFHVF